MKKRKIWDWFMQRKQLVFILSFLVFAPLLFYMVASPVVHPADAVILNSPGTQFGPWTDSGRRSVSHTAKVIKVRGTPTSFSLDTMKQVDASMGDELSVAFYRHYIKKQMVNDRIYKIKWERSLHNGIKDVKGKWSLLWSEEKVLLVNVYLAFFPVVLAQSHSYPYPGGFDGINDAFWVILTFPGFFIFLIFLSYVLYKKRGVEGILWAVLFCWFGLSFITFLCTLPAYFTMFTW